MKNQIKEIEELASAKFWEQHHRQKPVPYKHRMEWYNWVSPTNKCTEFR